MAVTPPVVLQSMSLREEQQGVKERVAYLPEAVRLQGVSMGQVAKAL